MIQFKITGADSVADALKSLPQSLAKQAATVAVASAVQPVLNAARANSSKSRRTGALQRSIGFFVRKYRRGNLTYAVLGARRGMGAGNNEPANYAHLVENGHMMKNGKRSQAKPFMRPAWDAQKGNAMKQLTKVFGKEVQMEIAKRSRSRKRNKGISAI